MDAKDLGRRIERGCRNPLAEAIRRSYWQKQGPGVWARICKNSLRRRLETSWAPVVEILGRD